MEERSASSSQPSCSINTVSAVTRSSAPAGCGSLIGIYGGPTALPWGFLFVRDGQTVPCHPTQIYEMLYCLAALAVTWPLYWYTDARRREGLLLGVFFEIVFVTRFLLEFIKNDQEAFEAGHVLNMGQLLSIPFILLGAYLIIRAYKRPLSPVVEKQPESLDPKYRQNAKVKK